MKTFNRERFLFWMLAGVLAYQGLLFGYGLVRCANANVPPEQIGKVCPEIGDRFDAFSDRTLAAVMGLIAGGVAVKTLKKASASDDRDVSASPLPPQPLPPSPESFSSVVLPVEDQEQKPGRGGRKT